MCNWMWTLLLTFEHLRQRRNPNVFESLLPLGLWWILGKNVHSIPHSQSNQCRSKTVLLNRLLYENGVAWQILQIIGAASKLRKMRFNSISGHNGYSVTEIKVQRKAQGISEKTPCEIGSVRREEVSSFELHLSAFPVVSELAWLSAECVLALLWIETGEFVLSEGAPEVRLSQTFPCYTPARSKSSYEAMRRSEDPSGLSTLSW